MCGLRIDYFWLIEKEDKENRGKVTGICLGECKGSLKWTTPDRAMRFARKQDAEAVGRVFNIDGIIATNHEWSELEQKKIRNSCPQNYVEDFLKLERDRDRFKNALAWLVELKVEKEENGKSSIYLENKEKAWDEAKAVIADR